MADRPAGHQRFSLFHRSADEEAGRRAWHHAYADVFAGFGSVLDVGCGTGVFLDMLRERGVTRTLGIDRDPEMVADTQARGHDARVLDARTALAALAERFDGVHLAFVIETMDGDEGIAALRGCASLLAPDGTLVVRTLNPRNAAVRDGAFWFEPWAKRPWPLETLHVALSDLGLRIVGAGNEPDGWQHVYIVGRAPSAPPAGAGRARVALQGEFFAYNSMATVNRELARALLVHEPSLGAAQDGIAIVPDEPAPEPSVAADPRFAPLRATVRRGVPPCDVLVRQSNGSADFRRPDGVRALVQILPWEYGALPQSWVDGLRADGTDEVWTPSEYCRTMFLEAGIAPERVAVVPNGIDPERFSPDAPLEPYPLATQASFRFLYLGGALPRKGVDVLLAAYRRAFTRGDDVALVLKLFGTRTFYQLEDGGAALRAFAADPGAPELVVMEEELSDDDVVRLYRSCDALAFPYRSEGFGLPMLEALACGLPVIATAGGAADAFLGEDAELVPARRVPLDGVMRGERLAGEGWWLEPDVEALAATLRRVAAHPDEARAKARRGADRVRRDWTWERAAAVAAKRLERLTPAEHAAPATAARTEPMTTSADSQPSDQRIAERRIIFGDARAALRELELRGHVALLGTQRSLAALGDDPVPRLATRRYAGAANHNPRSTVDAAGAVVDEHRCATVVATGSSAAIDLGKAVADGREVLLVLIPSALGGAEMSRGYGVLDGDRKGGGRLRSPAQVVIYDAALLATLPPRELGSIGINAWAHTIEASYARTQHALGTAAAADAGRRLPSLLRTAATARDEKLHRALFEAAHLAGFALDTRSMGLHHAVCHVIGGLTQLPHGINNAIVLPHAVRANAQLAPEAVVDVAMTFGIEDLAAEAEAIAAAYGLPRTFKELGVPADLVERALPRVMEQHLLDNNPVRPDEATVHRLLRRAYDGT